MLITRKLTFLTLSLVLLLASGACSGVEVSSEPVSDVSIDSATERLSQRVDDTLAELSDQGDDLQVTASETVTLSQLQEAGIPVGSHEIACDDPLDMVFVEGMFDRENLFTTGASLAGGTFEGMALRMVGQIYDPETDMPLGMIGDETGGRLTSVTQDESIASSSVDSEMMLSSSDSGSSEGDRLVPEAICQ